MLPKYIDPESWIAFLEMRKAIKAPVVNAYAEKRLLNTLERLRAAGHDPQACLDQSIEMSYRGIFPARDDGLVSKLAAEEENKEKAAREREHQKAVTSPEAKRARELAMSSLRRVT